GFMDEHCLTSRRQCWATMTVGHAASNAPPTKRAKVEGDEKLFSCSECGKKLGSKSGLNYHMRIHSGEKPFKCSYCGNSFRSLGHRNEHIRIVHNKQPYACLTCGERFDQHGDSRRHMTLNEGHQTQSRLEEKPADEEPNDDEPGPSRICSY
ncbi:hypothetical protein PMAYCL1PPCAC_27816, partial [Pristionchus mayeri]